MKAEAAIRCAGPLFAAKPGDVGTCEVLRSVCWNNQGSGILYL